MDKLIPAFKESLINPSLKDVGVELAELGIDSILDSELVNSIPIVKTILGVGKLAQNLYDRNLVKQTISFIVAINNGTVSSDKLERYKQKLNSNPKSLEEELGRVILYLNSNIYTEKSEILAKIYLAYIDEKYDWRRFCELAEVTNRVFVEDLYILDEILKSNTIFTQDRIDLFRINRLESIGLIVCSRPLYFQDKNSPMDLKHCHLSEMGKLYTTIVFN